MDRTYRIFTDGSAIGNPGPGGWGVVAIHGKERWEMSGAHRVRLDLGDSLQLHHAIDRLARLTHSWMLPRHAISWNGCRRNFLGFTATQSGWPVPWQQ